MFFNNQKKQEAQILAPQLLKIIEESRQLVNTTLKPDVFFPRYELLKEKSAQLLGLSKYIKLKGTRPEDMVAMITAKEHAATMDFLHRYFESTEQSAAEKKTEKGARAQFDRFYQSLQPYYSRMDAEHIAYIEGAYGRSVARIGGRP